MLKKVVPYVTLVILAILAVLLFSRLKTVDRRADDYRNAMRQAWSHIGELEITCQFVADIEVRSAAGTVIATQTIRASECVPDEEIPDGCAISWSWPKTFPTGSVEWYRPRFDIFVSETMTETVFVPTYLLQECPIVDPEFCKVTRESGQPSDECLAALADCGIGRDEHGYYNNGIVSGGTTQIRHGVWFEPLLAEWWENCPVPPPTATPYIQPTYTPAPTDTPLPLPTCLPTPLPEPTYTPLPTSTPYPTEVPYPTQPPW